MKATRISLLRASSLGVTLGFAFFGNATTTGDAVTQANVSNSLRINVVESSEDSHEVVESSEDSHESLQEKPPLQFASSRILALTIEVDDSIKYQQVDGFGASLTDSSAWLISQKLSETQRVQLLEMLFDPRKGIGLSILCQPIGAKILR
jgi:O-glycosyl hydrolase